MIKEHLQSTHANRIIPLGILLALLYWLLESFVDAYLFHASSPLHEILFPKPDELWMRVGLVVLILAFSVYAHVMVTRQKRLQELCRIGEQTQQSLLNATTEGAMLLSPDGTIEAVNDKAAEELGRATSDIIGRDVHDLMPSDIASRMRAHEQTALSTRRPLRIEDEREGRWFDINIYPVIDGDGRVTRLGIFSREITDNKEMERELTRLSITDDLTGLFNQRHFTEKIGPEVDRAKRMGYPLCLVILDVDGFKSYNDTYGHLKGNEILKGIGGIIARSVRKDVDSAYRFGGDEFAVILPYAERGTARQIIERIGTRTARETGGVTISSGIAVLAEADTVRDLIHSADKMMYRQKNKARAAHIPNK